jgi:glutaconate CoA-transferase subunit B
VHPGESAETVRANTGFAYDAAPPVAETRPPEAADLQLLRGRVAHEVAETYPRFAAALFGRAAA